MAARDKHELPMGLDDGWVSWRAIKAAAARPTIWIATWGVLTLLSLSIALPWQAWFADVTAHRYAPDELIRSLTAAFRHDHARAMGQLDAHAAQTGAVMGLAAVVCGVFAAGGWLFLFLDGGDGPRLRRFLTGGARYFWRFLRVWLVAMVLLGVLAWALYDDPWDSWVLSRWLRIPSTDHRSLESLHSELHAAGLGWARDGLFFLGFALVLTTATYARTRLAWFARFSALGAFLASFGTILRHPIRTLRPLIALALFQLVFVTLGLGWAVRGISTQLGTRPSWLVVLALFLVGQLAVLLRELGRGARYAAAFDVTRSLRPEPGPRKPAADDSAALGGPGGPQYPLDDDLDETGSGFGATV